jgi:hypothetical protein
MRLWLILGYLARPATVFVLAIGLSLALTACQTMGSVGTDKVVRGATFCEVASPLSWSKTDSRDTQEQISEHNAVGIALCGWGVK